MFSGAPGIAVFDLDGTLVDSLEDIRLSANGVRERHGLPPLSRGAVAPLIGLPAAELFRSDAGALLVDDIPNVVMEFRALLAEVTGAHTEVFPCVQKLLSGLRERGWHTAVATNKPTALAQLVLERMNLLDLFDGVHGADGLPPKPDPAVVRSAIGSTRWGAVIMVGDTTMDISAGRAAGAHTIAVASGSHGRRLLEMEQPDLVVESLCELVPLLG